MTSTTAIGIDLGDHYLWAFKETPTTGSHDIWSAVTSTDLATFSIEDFTLDGAPAGTQLAPGQWSEPPSKIISFNGKYYGIPQFSSSITGPSNFYQSSDAIAWTSMPPMTAGGVLYSFKGSDIAANCPYINNPDWDCDPAQDIIVTPTQLFLLLYDRVLSTSDLIAWNASKLPIPCTYGTGSIAYTGGRLVVSNGTSLCLSTDGGATWAVTQPIVAMNGFTFGANEQFTVSELAVGNGHFLTTGGYDYRSFYFTSNDGVTWTGTAAPTSNASCATPLNSGIAFTGLEWVDLDSTCQTAFGDRLSTSPEGAIWTQTPVSGNSLTYLLAPLPNPIGSSVDTMRLNRVVVRGTNDVIIPASYGNQKLALVRVHY